MTLPSLIELAQDKFDSFIKKWCGTNAAHLLDNDDNDGEFFRDFISSLTTKAHNAALEESFDYFENLIGALGSKLVLSGRVSLEDLDIIKQESRAKLSALKKEI